MKRTRQILLLTLVATALCADHIATAAPQLRVRLSPSADPIARLASSLGSRLSGTFRRASHAIQLQPVQRQGDLSPQRAAQPLPVAVILHQIEGSPFQFRLPPPAC